MRNVYLLFAAMLIYSCNNSNSSELEGVVFEDSNDVAIYLAMDTLSLDFNESVDETLDQLYIVHEEFILKPFEFNSTLEQVSEHLSSIASLKLDTIIDDSHVDSLIYFKLGVKNSEFYFVKGYVDGIPTNFLAGARIFDQEIKLRKGVKVGMSKEEFYSVFRDERIKDIDIIEIGDYENNSVFEFLFREDVLVEINFMGYIG